MTWSGTDILLIVLGVFGVSNGVICFFVGMLYERQRNMEWVIKDALDGLGEGYLNRVMRGEGDPDGR